MLTREKNFYNYIRPVAPRQS